jgi:uncharacterized protein (TIGR00255 family)
MLSMTHSMTGYGRADGDLDGDLVSIELSSVNHRYLDCSVRSPYVWSALEPIIKETVRKRIARGKVNVNLNRKRGVSSQRQTVVFDTHVAKQYIDAAHNLSKMLGTMETLSLNTLAALEGVFDHEEPEEDLDRVQEVIVRVLNEAITRLDAMRLTEGKALAEELRYRVSLMRESLANIERRLPELNEIYEQRLRARIDELKTDVAVTEERIAMEIAFMADKGDVTEEVVRLKTHFDHMSEMLDRNEPIGRELSFLSQELQREVNTLGSKLHDGEVIKEVIRMKSEVERVREQMANIE